MNIIKELRRKKGITQSELANFCGIHQTAVSQWENGRTLPDKQSLIMLSDLFGVSVDMLIGGHRRNSDENRIPVLGYVRAGQPVEAVENILGYELITDDMAMNGEYFGLEIKGDSMRPRMWPGDVIIVKRQDYIENGEIAVVLVGDMEATVKKIIKNGTSLTLVPFNPEYEPLVFTSMDVVSLPVKILGKVVELRGKV